MGKTKSYTKELVFIAILAVIIAGVFFYISYRSGVSFDVSFAPDMTLADNALMGFAPDAGNEALCENSNLVFIELTWAEWEPEDNVFAIDNMEKKYNIARWKEENKHAVLRFVCDIPGEKDHLDIPEWLYEKTDSGSDYNNDMGRGYSPDYSDDVFLKYHERALKALAQYCNQDNFVSFVELGSIGHNGKWYAWNNDGSSMMPSASVCFDYASLYSDSFVNARLLTGKNYDFAVNGNLGVYNDLIGDTKETGQWLQEIEKGGKQDTSDAALNLEAMSGFGKTVPVGGELTDRIPMEELMGTQLGEVLADVSSLNMTFMGPTIPDYTSETYELAADSLKKRMGYRIYVSELKAHYNFADNVIELEVSMKNAGNAGFFFDWPVTVYIYDAGKNLIFWEGLPINLTELSDTEAVTALSKIPYANEIRDEFYVGMSISDYNGKEGAELAVDTDAEKEYVDDVCLLYHYVRD